MAEELLSDALVHVVLGQVRAVRVAQVMYATMYHARGSVTRRQVRCILRWLIGLPLGGEDQIAVLPHVGASALLVLAPPVLAEHVDDDRWQRQPSLPGLGLDVLEVWAERVELLAQPQQAAVEVHV